LKKNTSYILPLLILLFTLALTVLNIIRIIRTPLTIDEAGTFINCIHSSYWDIITCKPASANNHILHSLLCKFFIGIFGTGEFAQRLDNLLAQMVFMLFVYLSLKKLFNNGYLILISFLILNLSPFMFDFWCLSRGYGLSLAFMSGSVFYVIKYLQNNRTKDLWLCFLFATGAVYSNLSMVNFFMAIPCTVFLRSIVQPRGFKTFIKKELAIVVTGCIILGILIAEPIYVLKKAGEFDFGYWGTSDIVTDTLRSLIRESLYKPDNNAPLSAISVLVYLIISSIIVQGLYWTYHIYKYKLNRENKLGFTLWLLLILPAIIIILEHYLLDTKYILNRAGLFFVITYKLSLIYWFYHIGRKMKFLTFVPVTIFALACSYNFMLHIQLDGVRLWWFDRYNVAVIDRVLKNHDPKNGRVKIAVNWQFYGSFYYYQETKYKDKIQVTSLERHPEMNNSYDYYYIDGEELKKMPDTYLIDTCYLGCNFTLMRKK